jgi:hypothetical protein
MRGTRWITIGTVYRPGHFIYCGSLTSQQIEYGITWHAGREDWCQPFQFESEEGLRWAVERRLAFAGLRLVSWDLKTDRADYQWPDEYRRLHVTVARSGKKLLNRKERKEHRE